MKKQLFLSCVLGVLSVVSVFGQLTLIPKAGATYSTFFVSDDVADGQREPGYKVGFIVGSALEIGMNDMLAIQPEFVFIQKGMHVESMIDGFKEESTMTMNYLELPVLVKLKLRKFYINAGPSFGYGIGGNHTYKVTYRGDSYHEEGDIKFGDGDDEEDIYIDHAFDFGVQVGGGVKAGPLVLDLRYGLGLTNMNDEPEGFEGKWWATNSVFQFTLGYPIPLGVK